jgi:curli biogenesis system outer membrane secretion channel CsgG
MPENVTSHAKELPMKRVAVLSLLFLALLCCSAVAADKPRIGVIRFTNTTAASWWHGTSGSELQDMLINELAATKAFSILERRELDKVIGELSLGESGLVDPGTRKKLGRLKGAEYLVAGTVSSFEHNTEGTGGGLSFMGFSVGGKKENAYIAVDVKLINVETGEITESRTIEATSSAGGMNVSGGVAGLSGNLGRESKTPVGKAIRACIVNIADYLECRLTAPAGDSCHRQYAEKEKRRREKTRQSIELDE